VNQNTAALERNDKFHSKTELYLRPKIKTKELHFRAIKKFDLKVFLMTWNCL